MPSDGHHVRVRTLDRIDAARRANDKRVPHGIVRIAGQRLRHRGERLRLVLGCEAHLMREAIRRNQTQSDAIIGNQRLRLVPGCEAQLQDDEGGNQVAIRCTQVPCPREGDARNYP